MVCQGIQEQMDEKEASLELNSIELLEEARRDEVGRESEVVKNNNWQNGAILKTVLEPMAQGGAEEEAKGLQSDGQLGKEVEWVGARLGPWIPRSVNLEQLGNRRRRV